MSLANVCGVCAHPQRASIDAALLRRETSRRVSALFGVSYESVTRHKSRHLRAQVKKVERDYTRGLLDEMDRERRDILRKVRRAEVNGIDPRLSPAMRREWFRLAERIGIETKQLTPLTVQNVIVDIGASSLEEARRIIAESKRLASEYTLADAERDAIDALRTVVQEHPERAESIRAAIFEGPTTEGRHAVALLEDGAGGDLSRMSRDEPDPNLNGV